MGRTGKQTEGLQKPLIAILMAVYEPNMDWLREQLESLEAQTYPNLKLFIRDDYSSEMMFEAVRECVKACIHSFPFELRRNEKNLGSNATFERLTRESEGVYFAYCDQDDVWPPEKLTTLQEAIERENALLVCSDMYIIDENGRQTADSITKIRRHHVFRSGEGLAPQLLFSCFVTGCTMLVDAKQARAAVPFCPYMVHDHYLAFWCAAKGRVHALRQPLIRYRIHRKNQTSKMAGVTDKQSYCRLRIEAMIDRLEWLRDRFADDASLRAEIEIALEWTQARRKSFQGDRRAKWTVWHLRRFSPQTALFEIFMSRAPNALFMRFIELERKNVL